MGGVRNNALLSAAEVVVIKVLEPHSSNEQEVPAVGAALLDVVNRALARYAAVLCVGFLGGAKCLIELTQQIDELEVLGRLERIVITGKRQRHAEDREEPSAGSVVYLRHVLRDAIAVQECRNRDRFFGFLIDHHCHANAAVRVASAAQLSPICAGTMDQIGPVRKSGHK